MASPTPLRLAQHGFELQSYQKTSLQWLIDKERNPSGMGTAGELWFRMRGRNGSGNQTFFYCELTRSIVTNIFNYSSDIDQDDITTIALLRYTVPFVEV